MAPMPSKYEAASFHHSCTSLHDGNTRPLQGAWAIKGNGTILMEFHRLNCRRGIIRCGNLWLCSGGKFLLRHFYLLLSVPHHIICLVPSTLSILAAILTTSSVSLYLSILNIPQLLCLLAPSFSQQFVPYFLTQLVLVIQPYNLVLPLTMPSFSNLLLPTFISTSPLSPIVPNFLTPPTRLTTSQQFPALASSVLRNSQLHPLPSQCAERGRSWEHSSTQSPVLHCSSPGHHHRKVQISPELEKSPRPVKVAEKSNTDL